MTNKTYPSPLPPRIIGSFEDYERAVYEGKMTQAEYQKIFEESRKHGLDGSIDYAIGGSTAPLILGVSEYGGPAGVAADLFHVSKRPKAISDEKPLVAGHIFESAVREYFAYLHKLDVRPCYYQVVNPNWPHCLANIDGIVWEKDPITGEKQMGIYEGKTLYNLKGPHADSFRNGIVPEDYMIQIQFYMEVWNLNFCWINCSWGYNEGQQVAIRVPRDRDLGCYICSKCEELVENGKLGQMPSNKDVSKIKALLADNARLYPYGDNALPKVKLASKYIKTMQKADELMKQIKVAKDELAPIEDSISEKQKEITAMDSKIKELLRPIADELGDATLGIVTNDATGEEWEVKFPESSGFSTKKSILKRFEEDLADKYSKKDASDIISLLSSYEPNARKLSYSKVKGLEA